MNFPQSKHGAGTDILNFVWSSLTAISHFLHGGVKLDSSLARFASIAIQPLSHSLEHPLHLEYLSQPTPNINPSVALSPPNQIIATRFAGTHFNLGRFTSISIPVHLSIHFAWSKHITIIDNPSFVCSNLTGVSHSHPVV